jgi:hypothetical protein
MKINRKKEGKEEGETGTGTAERRLWVRGTRSWQSTKTRTSLQGTGNYRVITHITDYSYCPSKIFKKKFFKSVICYIKLLFFKLVN